LLSGSEAWVKRRKEENRIQATEIRLLRPVKGCPREDRMMA
jgi:hypothetical protein